MANQEPPKPSIIANGFKLYKFKNLDKKAQTVAIESFREYVHMTHNQHISFELQNDDYYSETLSCDYGIDIDARSFAIELERSWLSLEVHLQNEFFEKIIESYEGNEKTSKEYVKECFDMLSNVNFDYRNLNLYFHGSLTKLNSYECDLLSDEELYNYYEDEEEGVIEKIEYARDLIADRLESAMQWLIDALDKVNDYYESDESIIDFLQEANGDEFFYDIDGKPVAKINYSRVNSNYWESSNTISFINVQWNKIITHEFEIEFEEI